MRLASLRSTCVYLNINGRYDRPKISHKLQVNVPRAIGILRDSSRHDAAPLDRMKPTPLSWVQHSLSCRYPHPPTRVPSHFTYSQNTNTISLHLLYHLSTLTSLKQCPYISLPDLHARVWRQKFHLRFMCHSLLRTLLQPELSSCTPASRKRAAVIIMFLFPKKVRPAWDHSPRRTALLGHWDTQALPLRQGVSQMWSRIFKRNGKIIGSRKFRKIGLKK